MWNWIDSTQGRRALVLGATGGVGGEVAHTLAAQGWNVRAMHRNPMAVAGRGSGWTWVQGDAMRAEDVLRAAEGADVIVHAVNPPGYRRWSELVLPMVDSTIAAALAHGARIVLPGTVYNYGPDAFPLLREDSPQRAVTRKGAIRVEMERRLADSGVQTLVVRGGDFFGPRAGNNWFSQGLLTPGKPVRTISYPGARGVGHQWSYLPDVAQTIAQLLDRTPASTFETFHMASHWDADGTRMVEAIQRAVVHGGGAMPRVRAFPWALMMAASPFVATLREMREMRYLWKVPLQLDGTKLAATLGSEPHTPWDVAVQATLEGLGCVHVSSPRQIGASALAP